MSRLQRASQMGLQIKFLVQINSPTEIRADLIITKVAIIKEEFLQIERSNMEEVKIKDG